MILIESIKYIETDRNPVEIIKYNHPNARIGVMTNEGADSVECKVIRELAYGRRFVRPSDNKDITIATSKEAADIIGIQYEAWEGQEKRYNECINENIILAGKIKEIKELSIFNRVRFVFNRYIW